MDTQQADGRPQGKLLDGWLTRKEVAEHLGVSTETLERWANQRIGPPYVRLGRKVVYRVDAVHDWLLSSERVGQRSRRGK